MLSISEQKDCLKRQLELVKENQELTKELEFRDYRMKKLEKELEEMKQTMLKLYEEKQHNQQIPTYTQINNYIQRVDNITIYG